MESASESEQYLAAKSNWQLKYLATKVLGEVQRYAGSARRVEQRWHSQQFGVHPSHQDLSMKPPANDWRSA